MEHTPGPWRQEQDVDSFGILHGWDIVTAEGQIATCWPEEGANVEADARLIAAAPELFEACKFAKEQIKRGAQKKALPILRAAIAKAEKGAF